MKYGLGIDAGGTYTDAVILSEVDGRIVESTKSPTTYPDPLTGIQNALDLLNPSYLKNVSKVSISTTLATNSLLENTVSEQSGYNVALIMIGAIDIDKKSDVSYYINVRGGHNPNGFECQSLDTAGIRDYVLEVKDKVSAFAISSCFSVRNPDHELKAKEICEEITGLPVVCGHELSQSLGSYERGITAYLNAQLVPITTQFMNTIVSEIKRRGIEARITMLKCDGSVVDIKEALRHPIESVFTGPAASLVGASYLAGISNCIAIDVGGTSTDVAKITDGVPEVTDEGAVVGGWHTKVKAIRMETSAMGGDSHVWIKNGKLNIGPRKVIPLCVAATKWPIVKEKLKGRNILSKMQLTENIQQTKFFIRTGNKPGRLSKTEKELYDCIGDEPASIKEIFTTDIPSSVFLDILIKKDLIQAIGFTPTDALHVLGDYTEWDGEACIIAAELLGGMTSSDGLQFCKDVKNQFTQNMAVYVMAYLLKDIDHADIKKIIENRDEYITKFKIATPVVLLGAPVQAYVDDIRDMIDTEIILPEYAEVGNAVGALVGKMTKRIEILIRKIYEGNKPVIMMFFPEGRKRFNSYSSALEEADVVGRRLITDYLNGSSLPIQELNIEVIRQDVKAIEEDRSPMEIKLVFIGVGTVDN